MNLSEGKAMVIILQNSIFKKTTTKKQTFIVKVYLIYFQVVESECYLCLNKYNFHVNFT